MNPPASDNRYRVILADPPWRFRTWSETNQQKSASRHYDLMQTEDIADLKVLVDQWAAPDCCLFLWATKPMLPHALTLGAAWGFEWKTVAFTWVKVGRENRSLRPIGTGYWTRANPEYLLLFTKGHPRRNPGAGGVRELFEAPDIEEDTLYDPPREHSRKPDQVYGMIESLVPGPYMAMFERQSWPGWDCWGNQTDRFVVGGGLSQELAQQEVMDFA